MNNNDRRKWEKFYLQKDPYGHDKYYSEKRRRKDSIGLLTSRQLHFRRCLELGCGVGKITEKLIDLSDQIIAVDISDNAINVAKAKLNANIDNIVFIQNDMYEIEFDEGNFDAIIALESLDYTSEKDLQITKWIKWIKSGGIILFSGPNLVEYFSYRELKKLFDRPELEILEMKIVTTKFPFQWFISRIKIIQNNFFWNINMFFANSFPKTFAKHIAILVRKK